MLDYIYYYSDFFPQVLNFEIWGIKSTNTQNKSFLPQKNIFRLPNVKL